MTTRFSFLALVLGLFALQGCGVGTQGSPMAATSTLAKAAGAKASPLPTKVTFSLAPNLSYEELGLQAAMTRDNSVWQMGYNVLEPGQLHIDHYDVGGLSTISTRMQGVRWDDPSETGYDLVLSGSYEGGTGKITFNLLKVTAQ